MASMFWSVIRNAEPRNYWADVHLGRNSAKQDRQEGGIHGYFQCG